MPTAGGFLNVSDKTLRGIIALICWATLLSTTAYHMSHMGFQKMVFMMSGYFSYWTIVATSIAFALSVFLERKRIVDKICGSMLMMMIIMCALYWPIAGIEAFLVAPFHSKVLHSLVPGIVAFYFLRYVEEQNLDISDAFLWTIIPIIYTLFIVARGYLTGVYPYEYADVSLYGYIVIFERIASVTLATIAIGLLLIGLKKMQRRDRSSAPRLA